MKRSLINYFLFSSIVFLVTVFETFSNNADRFRSEEPDCCYTPVFGKSFGKALYHVKIEGGKKVFSCLAMIKKYKQESGYRIAFFTESGMRLLEIGYETNGKADVHYVTAFLDKKRFVKKISSDLLLLFPELRDTSQRQTAFLEKGTECVWKVRRSYRSDYFFPPHHPPVKIKQKGWRFYKTTIHLKDYANSSPGTIIFSHKGVHFSYVFKKVTER